MASSRARVLCWMQLFLFSYTLLVDGSFFSNGRYRRGRPGFTVLPRSICSTLEYPNSHLTQLFEQPEGTDATEPSEQKPEIEVPDEVPTVPKSKTHTSSNGKTPPIMQEAEIKPGAIEGIGGKGGAVYDVNRLKRNLLQETMTAYKEELWELLADGDDAEIVDKLLALVQASPVRTTTDSNLLDGEDDWTLAYRSQFPTTVSRLVLYESDNLVAGGATPSYNPRYAFLWNETSPSEESTTRSKTKNFLQRNAIMNKFKEFFQTKQRTFRLENLEDDEDAYVMDTTMILGGLVTKTKRYSLDGLTRSSLSLKKMFSLWSLMGRSSSKRLQEALKQQEASNDKQGLKSVQIVYLDNDVCILTEESGPDSPFMVYTRNKAYVSAYTSMKRKFKIFKAASWDLLTLPIRGLTQKGSDGVAHPPSSLQRRRGYGTADLDDPILKEIIQSEAKPKSNANTNAVKLRVLRLGDVNETEEDESWESESDPFVHLSADERQRILKNMSVEEVEQAADSYRNSRFRFRWLRKLFRRRKTNFKKPPENWKRPKK